VSDAAPVHVRPACRSVCAISQQVTDNPELQRFELRVDGELVGWSEYRPAGKTVIPVCPFAAAYIRRHPEYLELVEPHVRGRFAPPA
jgi:hypothetical protein